MSGEIGTMALLLLSLAALLASLPAWLPQAALRRPWMQPVRGGQRGLVLAQLGLAAVAAAAMQWALQGDDFSVSFVAGNSSAGLPWGYKVTAMWGGHEGSMLLWLLLLTAMAGAFCVLRQGGARALGLLSLLSLGFGAFTLLTSNPFARLLPLAPTSGADLNPLLQHPGMAWHPPLLYAGYLSLAPGFCLAVDALLRRGVAAAELATLRHWSLLAFALLTCGIGLGSWWAYNELGWGGWWFWDPVENVSLLPWLAALVLVHGLRVPHPSPAQVRWLLAAAVIAFAAGLFGAFAVRSGILVSVHSFAADPGRGVALLAMLGAALLPLALVPMLGREGQGGDSASGGESFATPSAAAGEAPRPASISSRETAVLAQAVLAATAFVTLLCGVLYPPLHTLFAGRALSVGAPYFEQIMTPLGLAALALAALVPLTRWGGGLARRPAVSAGLVAAALLLAALLLVAGLAQAGPPVPAVLTAWLAASVLAGLVPGWVRQWRSRRLAWRQLPMAAAHLGAALVLLVAGWETSMGLQAEVALHPGGSAQLGETRWHWEDERPVQGPNWSGWELRLRVEGPGGAVHWLHPQKRLYAVRGQNLSEVAVLSLPGRDYYASLGERLGGSPDVSLAGGPGAVQADGSGVASGGWTLRLFVKPLLSWLWLGVALVALGALLAWAQALRLGRP